MKNWGTGLLPALLAAGCAAPPASKPAYEPPADGKQMVDRLRVDQPYQPRQNGVEPLSLFIEASPTYYPPPCWNYGWGYRPVKWSDCGYRPAYWKDCGARYRTPYLYPRRDCPPRW